MGKIARNGLNRAQFLMWLVNECGFTEQQAEDARALADRHQPDWKPAGNVQVRRDGRSYGVRDA